MSVISVDFQAGTRFAHSTEDPALLVLGVAIDNSIQWVKLPTDLGGEQVNVRATVRAKCACGDHEADCIVTDAESGGSALCAFECPPRGEFLWALVPNG